MYQPRKLKCIEFQNYYLKYKLTCNQNFFICQVFEVYVRVSYSMRSTPLLKYLRLCHIARARFRK